MSPPSPRRNSTSRYSSPVHTPQSSSSGSHLVNVKVLYTVGFPTPTECLTRISHPCPVSLARLDNGAVVGAAELGPCLDAVITASPELVTSFRHDFNVYAYDYSEASVPIVGQGRLSSLLAESASKAAAASNEARPRIVGLVRRDVSGSLFQRGPARSPTEALEVKLKFVPVPHKEATNEGHSNRMLQYDAGRQSPVSWVSSPDSSHHQPLESPAEQQLLGRHSRQSSQQEPTPSAGPQVSNQGLNEPPSNAEVGYVCPDGPPGNVRQWSNSVSGNGALAPDGPRKRARIEPADGVVQTQGSRFGAPRTLWERASIQSSHLMGHVLARTGIDSGRDGSNRAPTPRPYRGRQSIRAVSGGQPGPLSNLVDNPGRRTSKRELSASLSLSDMPSSPPEFLNLGAGMVSMGAGTIAASVTAGAEESSLSDSSHDSAPKENTAQTAIHASVSHAPSVPSPQSLSEILSAEEVELKRVNGRLRQLEALVKQRSSIERSQPQRSRDSHAMTGSASPTLNETALNSTALPTSTDPKASVELLPRETAQPASHRPIRPSTDLDSPMSEPCYSNADQFSLNSETTKQVSPAEAGPNNRQVRPIQKKPDPPNNMSLQTQITGTSSGGDIILPQAFPVQIGTIISKSASSGSRRKREIHAQLITNVAAGNMPRFCLNCGEIEPATWRKAYTRIERGDPVQNGIVVFVPSNPRSKEVKEVPAGAVVGIESLPPDLSAGDGRRYRVWKRGVGPGERVAAADEDEDSDAFHEVVMCNPCGLWFSLKGTMRPPHRWAKPPERDGRDAETPASATATAAPAPGGGKPGERTSSIASSPLLASAPLPAGVSRRSLVRNHSASAPTTQASRPGPPPPAASGGRLAGIAAVPANLSVPSSAVGSFSVFSATAEPAGAAAATDKQFDLADFGFGYHAAPASSAVAAAAATATATVPSSAETTPAEPSGLDLSALVGPNVHLNLDYLPLFSPDPLTSASLSAGASASGPGSATTATAAADPKAHPRHQHQQQQQQRQDGRADQLVNWSLNDALSFLDLPIPDGAGQGQDHSRDRVLPAHHPHPASATVPGRPHSVQSGQSALVPAGPSKANLQAAKGSSGGSGGSSSNGAATKATPTTTAATTAAAARAMQPRTGSFFHKMPIEMPIQRK